MNLTVYRLTESPVIPTFGVLLRDNGIPFALSLERPWLNNQRGISCIPRGNYVARRHVSPKFGETFLLVDVPGRSEILLHKGNIDDDSHGCILIGEEFNIVNGEDGITASEHGFAEFMSVTAGLDEFDLIVTGRP